MDASGRTAPLRVDVLRALLTGTTAAAAQFAMTLLLVRFPDFPASAATYRYLRIEGAKAAAIGALAALALYRLRRAGSPRWPLVAPLAVLLAMGMSVLLLHGLAHVPPRWTPPDTAHVG